MAENNNLFANQEKIYREVDKTAFEWLNKQKKTTILFTVLIFVVITAFSLASGNSGKIAITFSEDIFVVGLAGNAVSVSYDSIEKITLSDNFPFAMQPPENKDGYFAYIMNSDSGYKTYVYCHDSVDCYLIIDCGSRTVIFNCASYDETQACRDNLLKKCGLGS